MIPYEELCSALAQWRERNGLANGPSARPPQGPVIVPPPPAPVAEAPAPPAGDSTELVFAASTSSGFGDSVPTEEFLAGDGGTAITPAPYEPEAEVLYDAEEPEENAPTGLHFAATEDGVPSPRETTNELELDDLVSDEDDPARPR
jgi:hypothetical protein